MLVFSSTLKFNTQLVPEPVKIPVCFADIVIGNCRLQVRDHRVVGIFQVDEEILKGVDFYYQIYPVCGRSIKQIQISFIPCYSILYDNPQSEITN